MGRCAVTQSKRPWIKKRQRRRLHTILPLDDGSYAASGFRALGVFADHRRAFTSKYRLCLGRLGQGEDVTL